MSSGYSIKIASALAAALMAITVSLPVFGREPNWPSGPYKYIIVNQDVRQVLIEFGRNLNLPVKISDQVQPRRLRGPFAIMTAGEFLKTVCDSAGLVWYYDGTVLHISSAGEISTASIDTGSLASPRLMRQLENLGVLDGRYPLKIDAASGVISLAGPPPYITAIRQSLQSIANTGRVRVITGGDDKTVRVFRAGKEGT